MNLEQTIATIRAARWNLTLHIKLARGRHSYAYQCIDFPQLSYMKTTNRGRIEQKTFAVSGHDDAFDTLEAAAAAIVKAESGS